MYTADCSAPSAATPTSRPPISDTRRSGVSARRLKKPLSMSSARLVPVLISENIATLDERDGDREGDVGVRGEARQPCRRLQPAGVHREQHQREEDDREQLERLAQGLSHRAPGEHADLGREQARRCMRSRRGAATARAPLPPRRSSSPAPSSERPVLARNTSSSVGECSRRSAIARPSASSVRTISARSLTPSGSRTATPLGDAAASSPKRYSTPASRSRSPGSCGITSTLGRPICRLQLGRRALGDDLAAVDDPDAVGQHVGLLEVLRRQEHRHAVVRQPAHLVPQRGAALRVEAGGRLVQEQQPRAVHEREAEVQPALHPARVAADLAIGRVGQPDPLEQFGRRAVRARPCRGRAARSAGACARGRSGTGRARTPAARRRSRGAPRRPECTTSSPATRALPAVGGSSVVSTSTVVDLPGAVGAEEAVDLPGSDAAGRSRRPRARRP